MAHSAEAAHRAGVSDEKIAAILDYRTSPLFTDAERVAIEFAVAAASQPNAVTEAHFVRMRRHWNEGQIVEIAGVVALNGFLNRWNDTMAPQLEREPLAFATTLARLNPNLVLTYVTGSHTDENGKRMWQRVKGRAESALAKLPLKGVYNFRPGLMTPKRGQKHLKTGYKIALVFAPLLKLFFPALTLEQVGKAMLQCVKVGAPKTIVEIPDIRELAAAY